MPYTTDARDGKALGLWVGEQRIAAIWIQAGNRGQKILAIDAPGITIRLLEEK